MAVTMRLINFFFKIIFILDISRVQTVISAYTFKIKKIFCSMRYKISSLGMNLQLGFNVKKTILLKTKEKMVNKDGFSTKEKGRFMQQSPGRKLSEINILPDRKSMI